MKTLDTLLRLRDENILELRCIIRKRNKQIERLKNKIMELNGKIKGLQWQLDKTST